MQPADQEQDADAEHVEAPQICALALAIRAAVPVLIAWPAI
jgi:hypothetical protein